MRRIAIGTEVKPVRAPLSRSGGHLIAVAAAGLLLGACSFSAPPAPVPPPPPAGGTTSGQGPAPPPPGEAGAWPPRLQAVRLEVPDRWRDGPLSQPREVLLPPGFRASVFAAGLGGPRLMALGPDGVVHVSVPRTGQIVALPDRNLDGVADEVRVVASGLDLPHGLAFRDGALYVAETGRIVRLEGDGGRRAVADLPPRGGHWTRTIGFGPDGRLYASAGSSCNVCREADPRRAAIIRFEADGSGGTVIARGLRNAVGLAWHPETGELWATENGRDLLGDDVPQDEINRVEEGRDYGWPRCHGDGIPDPEFGGDRACEGVTPPAIAIQAHSAPLGLRFYHLPPPPPGGAEVRPFPAPWSTALFVALHGSWNRSVPTGYKVIAVPFRDGRPTGAPADFLAGFLEGREAWGRPVDVLVAPDGALLVTDDRAGAIYRIAREGSPGAP